MISRRYETLFTAAALAAAALVIGGALALIAFARSPDKVPAAANPAAGPPSEMDLAAQTKMVNRLSVAGAAPKKQYDAPPKMAIDPDKDYTATLVTNMGDITVKLLAKDAPKTVNNFVFLAKEGFYDGTVFHRVIDDFMIQGGDPQGNGTGGPGYEFADETKGSANKFEPFTLAMANSGPNTNGSQFFITEVATSHLNGKHTIFGRVVEGKDVVTKIESVKTDTRDRPLKDVILESVKISEAGDAAAASQPTTKPAE